MFNAEQREESGGLRLMDGELPVWCKLYFDDDDDEDKHGWDLIVVNVW